MTPSDNVYYFNFSDKKVDIRVCLKNGYTSIRTAWVWSDGNLNKRYFKKAWDNKFGGDYYQHIIDTKNGVHCDGVGATNWRYPEAMKHQDIFDIPFRKNSFRIAVKRDPVKRFLSAVQYLDSAKNHKHYKSETHKHYIDLTNLDITNTNFIIESLENGRLKDEHFFPQSYFLGHKDQYHKVYDIKDLNYLLEYIESFGIEKNLKISNLKENPSSYKQKIILTPEQEVRIIKLYAQGYANGWY